MVTRSTQAMPYAYTKTVEVLRRGGKTVQKTCVDVGMTEGTLTEVAAFEAPVAASLFTWINRYPVNVPDPEGAFEIGDPVKLAFRHFEGAFYAPAAMVNWPSMHNRPRPPLRRQALGSGMDARSPDGMMLSSEIARMTDELMSSREMDALLGVFSHGSFHPDIADREIFRTVKDNEANGRNGARRFVEGLLVVDGELWQRVEEPKLAMVGYPDRAGTKVATAEVWIAGTSAQTPLMHRYSGLRVGLPSETEFFNLSGLESLRIAMWMAGRNPDLANVGIADVEIMMPEAFVFDGDAEARERIVAHVLSSTEGLLGGLDAGAVSTWLEMRAAFEAWKAGGAASFLSDAVAMLQDVLPYAGDGLREQIAACSRFLAPQERAERHPDIRRGIKR
jgi:hypothetical protein